MDARDLIVALRERDVWLGIEEGQVYVNAPVGVLTDETRKALRAKRTEIIALMDECVDMLRAMKTARWEWDFMTSEWGRLHERGDDGSEEYAEESRHLLEVIHSNEQWAHTLDERYGEFERLFGYGEGESIFGPADPPVRWLTQESIQRPEAEVDEAGIRREVIRI